ncbi:uncharacterized protein LOC107017675 isoform X5 [Solanum pennellii]|uniref:Uncharacterized protein LOC107017675 isoform X5 n=1 Tax=Solanum pennellii TaxID=28526 RepID=A0ABM1GMR3_SOLPN|nr:uncharacterized protein LOC107017675 isoform X5 [Solanum pennellii]
MDFENMKRKQLQALCKEHGIPANLTNLEMANKLSSLLKVNDEKPLTRGRSCLKMLDENESDAVNRKVKKVKFSPDNEVIEFTRSAQVKRGGRRNTMLYKNNLNVRSDGLKVGILDSPVRVTRSQGVNIEDGVTEKKGRTRQVKDSVISVNKSKDEVGVTTKRTLKNKEVGTILEKREENEGANDGVRMSRRVRSRKNAKESVEDSQEEPKMDESEKAIGREEKRDKKVTFISGGHMDECTKSETKAKEPKRVTRRKSMTHNQTLPVQSEVDAEVREEVVEKPARVTRSRNLKPVEDNLSNKRNRTRGRKAIETSEEQLCTEFVESSVEAVKDEARVITRGSRQNSVVEAPEKALKRSGRIANKDKGSRLSDDITKEKMVTGGRTRNQSSSTVQASTSESGTKIVESKGKHEVVLQLEEPVEVPPRRSDRRKSVLPLEKLRGDEVAAKKEKRNFLTVNDDELRQKVTEEPQKALKRSKRLATQVEDSVLAKDDIAENKIGRPTESQGTLEVVLQTGEVPVRSNRRKSVVPSLEKLRSDEVVVLKEKKTLNANDGEIGSKRTKEEPQKISKRSKRLAKQMEDPVLAKHDIAENKLEERRLSRRNVANANVDTKILDRSVQEETSVVKEERRRSGRSASRHTLAAVSDDKKEKGENQLTKRNCAVQDKDSTNKFTLQDLDSAKQSISSSKASVKASVVKKTSTAGKKQQGRLKRSNVEVEVLMPEDMEIVREPDNKDCNISGSGGTMSFSRSSLNELDAVPDDVNIVLAGTKDDTTAESSILADKLTEEGPLVDANSSLSENKSASKSLPFSDPFISDARPEENLLKELLQSDHEEQPASKGLCPGSVLADDAVPNDLTFDKQEPGATVVDNVEEFVTGLSNDVFDNCSLSQSNNMEEILDSGTKDDAAAESSPLADRLIEEGPLVDANASPSENNSISEPFSDSFNSNATPKQNLVEELLQCDHEAPAGKDLCPSPILADDAVPNEITSDKQEHGSIAAHNVEGLSDEILDNCSPSQSENMEENLDSGFKEQSETGCVVTEGVSHDEHEPASKVICPGSALADDAVPNDIISDKQEHGTVEADNAGLKEQSETGCIVMEGVTYGEQEPGSKGLCPSSVFADDAVPNDITSDKLEHGSIAADTAEEFDSGSSKEVLDSCSVNQSVNMEDKLDSGFKESSATRCIVSVGVNYGEQELTAMDYAKELDAGLSSNVLLDNLGAFNHSNEMECKISEAEAESGPVEQSDAESDLVEANYDLDAPTFTSQDEIHAEECGNLEVAAPEKTISSPIKTVLDLQVAERGILGDGITLHVTPLEDCDEEKQGEELKKLFATPGYVSHSKEEKKASLDGDSREEGLNREGQVSPISGNDTSSLQNSVCDYGEHGQGEYLKRLFATPFGGKSSKADIATSIAINETSSQYQHSFHENENVGEDLKGLFATPSVVSQSVGDLHYFFENQLSGEAMTTRGLGSSGKVNLSESVRGLFENKQVEQVRTSFASPVSVKCSHQETTSTKGNCSLSHEMEPYICSGVERDLSESVSEQQMVPEINQSSPNRIASPISEPTCDDIGFSEQQMLPEINKSSLGNIKTSDAFDDSTEDHLRLLFATPIKEVSPSRLGEASSCQLKTAMIAWASEMAGKQPKQGLEFAGEPLTVEIISGGSDRTKSSHFSKEIEQFKGGPLFPTPSKGTRPLQFEESPGCEEDIFKYLDGVKLLNNREQNFEQHSDCQFSNAITDDTSEETLHWIQTNDDNVPIQTELETQKEIGSARPFEPLHEEGEVTEDDPLAEGKEDNHPVPYQESIEDEVINTDEAAKSGALSDAICQKPNILLTDIKTENVTQESTSKTDGFSVSAESGILEFDAESTALRSQEPIIITVEETKGDEVQKLEVSNISNTFLDNILNDDEYAKNNSTVLPADEQFQFPEHYAIENDGSSTEGFTAFTNECQHVSKEDDLAAEGDRLVIFESNESTSMNVNDSGLTTQMDMPGIFAEEPQCGSDKEKPSAAKQQDDSFDKKEHESTEAVLSPSKSHESISFSEEGIAGEDKLIFEKKDELAEKKVALTPATGVAKTSFAKHLNSTVKKKNARSILIHGTPNKLTQIADMKENAPNVKGDIGTLTALRPDKRPALKDLPRK